MKECPSCFRENRDGTRVCEECGYEFETGFGSEGTRIAPVEITAFSKGDLIAGRYRVVCELGRGGMGVVYLAEDAELRDEQVALKMVHPALLANPEARGRFADEVLISQKLTHSSIVRVHDIKRWEGFRFFTMEYVKGQSLAGWLERRKEQKPPFNPKEVLSIMAPLLDALSYAHQYTIHRDVKPENIMVTGEFPEVRIKVLDFGIAKTLSATRFTHTAQALGTAYYMAPEQLRGKEIDHRADLFSVGMIIYEMLMGEVAVGIPELPSRVYPELPVEMDEIVGRLLKRDPNDRYPDALAVKKALADAVVFYEIALEERLKEEERRRRHEEIGELLEKGQSLFRARKWSEAEETFNRILKLDANHKAARTRAKDVREKETTRLNLLKQAQTAEDAGSLDKAISLLNKLIPLSQEEESLKNKKISLEQALKEQKEAQKQSEIAALTKKADALLEALRWSEASESLKRILTLDTEDEKARALLKEAQQKKGDLAGHLEALRAAEAAGNLETAIVLVSKAIPLSSERESLKKKEVLLNQKLEKRKKDKEKKKLLSEAKRSFNACRWPETEEILSRLLALDPGDKQAIALLDKTRENRKKLQELLDDIDRAEKLGALDKAILLLDEAMSRSPYRKSLEQKRSSLQEELDEKRKAEKEAKIAALMKDSEFALESRKWPEAEELFRRLLALNPDHDQAKVLLQEARETDERLKSLLKKMDAAEKRGDYETAIAAIETAVHLSDEEKVLEEKKARLKEALEKRQQEEIEKQRKADEERRKREEAEEEKKKQEEAKKEALRKKGEAARRAEIEQEESRKRGEKRKERQKKLSKFFGMLVCLCLMALIGHPIYQHWEKKIQQQEEKKTRENKYVGPSFTNDLGMKFVYIKPGNFIMGSPSGEPGRAGDEKQHRVTLTRGFYLQTTEVTQGQWKAVMGSNPSHFTSCGDDCPVEKVSWDDCQKFIQKLNRMQNDHQYRLPTEAEWEYACRAGTTTPFSFGRCLSTDQANYRGDFPLNGCSKGKDRKKTLPVGSLSPNAWGLYDMHGNVGEWCQDWYGDYPLGSLTDPVGSSWWEWWDRIFRVSGWRTSSYRVSRGGSWSNGAGYCRSAYRFRGRPGNRDYYLGFRLARIR